MENTNLVILSGDWADGDILREIRFINDDELEKFINTFEEIGELYHRFKEEYDFQDYGDLMAWLDEYGEEYLDDPMSYYMFIEEYFPYEGYSQTGCKYVTLSYTKVIVDPEDFKIINI